MSFNSIKIVVIHDGLIPIDDPLLIELKEVFGKEQVVHYENSNEGLRYVLENLSQKMIVLLDIDFNKDLSGIRVFEKIRKQTSLVYIIMITANELSFIKKEDLILMINHDAFAVESIANDYTEVIKLAKKAAYNLETRVDAILEEWISNKSKPERERPYLKTKDGKTYSLNEVLDSIRQQTDLGKTMERNILKLAVDLLVRKKTSLDG